MGSKSPNSETAESTVASLSLSLVSTVFHGNILSCDPGTHAHVLMAASYYGLQSQGWWSPVKFQSASAPYLAMFWIISGTLQKHDIWAVSHSDSIAIVCQLSPGIRIFFFKNNYFVSTHKPSLIRLGIYYFNTFGHLSCLNHCYIHWGYREEKDWVTASKRRVAHKQLTVMQVRNK